MSYSILFYYILLHYITLYYIILYLVILYSTPSYAMRGREVTYSVEMNKQGMPQARELATLDGLAPGPSKAGFLFFARVHCVCLQPCHAIPSPCLTALTSVCGPKGQSDVNRFLSLSCLPSPRPTLFLLRAT